MVGPVGVARAGVAVGPSTKRRKLGPTVPQTEGTPSPRLTLRGWLRGPEGFFNPPCDPMTQPELWEGVCV